MYVSFLHLLGETVWTGFLVQALPLAKNARHKFNLFVELERWDKAAEIYNDKLAPYFFAAGSNFSDNDFYGYFSNGVQALSNTGATELAIEYVQNLVTNSDVQRYEQERLKDVFTECQEL
jgi:hypothetical protein